MATGFVSRGQLGDIHQWVFIPELLFDDMRGAGEFEAEEWI